MSSENGNNLDETTTSTEITEPQEKKQLTERDVLMIVAKKVDEMSKEIVKIQEKLRHNDQFREDVMAQIDTIVNMQQSGPQQGPPGQPGAQQQHYQNDSGKAPITANEVNGLMDTGLKIVQTIGDMVQKFRNPALADNNNDPLRELKYEIGSRVVEKQLNPRISKESINFQDLIVDHS